MYKENQQIIETIEAGTKQDSLSSGMRFEGMFEAMKETAHFPRVEKLVFKFENKFYKITDKEMIEKFLIEIKSQFFQSSAMEFFRKNPFADIEELTNNFKTFVSNIICDIDHKNLWLILDSLVFFRSPEQLLFQDNLIEEIESETIGETKLNEQRILFCR